MGAGAWKTLSSCCSRSETSGNFLKEDENKENENKLHEFEQIENGINKQLNFLNLINIKFVSK